MLASSGQEVKALGRTVSGFVEEQWSALKFDIVFRANLLKFSQNNDLRALLLQTGLSLLR